MNTEGIKTDMSNQSRAVIAVFGMLLVLLVAALVLVARPSFAYADDWVTDSTWSDSGWTTDSSYYPNWNDAGTGCCDWVTDSTWDSGTGWVTDSTWSDSGWTTDSSYYPNWNDAGTGCCDWVTDSTWDSGTGWVTDSTWTNSYPTYTPDYYPSYTPSYDYDYDYGYYPSYSYYSPSYAYYQPQQPIYHTPSSNYSYYNNVQSTVNNNIDNSVVNNTNTNINTNTTPSYPSYPTYYPPVQYSYPRVVQAAPTVTVSGTRYVNISQVPYTGTDDVAYVLMLVAVALAGAAAFFFRGNLATAYATMTGRNDHFFFDEVPAEEADDSIAIGDTQEGSNSLAITRGADGPKLSFVQR